MRVLLPTVVLLATPAIGYSGTIYVPEDHATIQAAIVAAGTGDEIIVRPGTYVENIDFLGKAITVRSEHGADLTTIDGNGLGTVVTFTNGEGGNSILEGFTITGGYADTGGGILCEAASPTIRWNIIEDNTGGRSGGGGGGIACLDASPLLLANRIHWNTIDYMWATGGGVACWGGAPTLIGNLLHHNWGASGGGALFFEGSSALIENNLIWWNAASYGGGIWAHDSVLVASNNTFYGNEATGWCLGMMCYDGEGGAYFDDGQDASMLTSSILWGNIAWDQGSWYFWPDQIRDDDTSLEVSFCDVEDGWPGTANINADPLFADPDNGDYRLQQDPCQAGVTNPCVDTGDPGSTMVTGTTRTDGAQDTGVVDMGFHYPNPLAAGTFRNAGTNPASYAVTSPPIMGGTYTGTVDLGGTTGHAAALLMGHLSPWNVMLPGGQTILINITDPSGELLHKRAKLGPTAVFHVAIPNDVSLVGLMVYTQAVHVGVVTPWVLSNAQDLYLGY